MVVNGHGADPEPPGADILDTLVVNWKDRVQYLCPQLAGLVVAAEYAEFEGGDAAHWHFYFEVGDDYLEAVSNERLESFAFADDAGYFDDFVVRAEVPQRIVDRFKNA